jgi:hypothetical protein
MPLSALTATAATVDVSTFLPVNAALGGTRFLALLTADGVTWTAAVINAPPAFIPGEQFPQQLQYQAQGGSPAAAIAASLALLSADVSTQAATETTTAQAETTVAAQVAAAVPKP